MISLFLSELIGLLLVAGGIQSMTLLLSQRLLLEMDM